MKRDRYHLFLHRLCLRLPFLLLLLFAAAPVLAQPAAAVPEEPPSLENTGDVVAITCCNRNSKRSRTAPRCPDNAINTQEGAVAVVRESSEDTEAAAATALFGRDLQKAESVCLGLPIGEVEMQDCIGTHCQNEARRRRFISLMDLTVGRPLRKGQLSIARKRLLQTSFFRIPHVFCRVEYGRAKIAFKVLGNTFVRRIRFHDNEKVYAEQLRGRLIFQPGHVLRPASAAGQELLRRQCLVLETLYHKAGHEDAVIHIEARTVGIGLVGVDVTVEEGAKHRVSRYNVRIADPPIAGPADLALGLVCPPVTTKQVRSVSGLEGEDVFAGRLRVKARAKIRRYLRMRGYSKPKIVIDHIEADQEVNVHIRLGRCNLIRLLSRETDAARFRPINDESLLRAMSFSESGVFDLDEAERSRRAVHAMLENRGDLFAAVRMDFRKVPRRIRGRVDAAVTYYITTRYPAQIRGLRFPGLTHFEMAKVRGVIGTRSYDIFSPGGYLQIDQMLGDLSRLKQFYESEGFFEFRYMLQRSTKSRYKGMFDRHHYSKGENEIWEYLLPDRGFRVIRPEGEHFIYVDVPVVEGRRSQLTKLNVGGFKGISEAKVRQLIGLKTGGVISYRRLLEAVSTVERHYHDQGYFRMRLLLECWGRGYSGAGVAGIKSSLNEAKTPAAVSKGGVGGSGLGSGAALPRLLGANVKDKIKTPWQLGKSESRCSQALMLAEKVSVRLTIDEGRRVKTGEIFISGNFDTSAELLTRDLPRSGEAFSKPRLFESQRRLRNTGLFDSVTFEYIGVGEKPVRDNIAVVVRVVEANSRDLQITGGFQTVNADREVGTGGSQTVTTPPVVVDHIEQLTSNQQRLSTGFGDRMGAVLPSLLLTIGGSFQERNLWGEGIFTELYGHVGGTFAGTTVLDLFTPELLQAYWTLTFPRFRGSKWALTLYPIYANRDHATLTIDIDEVGSSALVSRRFGRLGFRAGLDLKANQTVDPKKTELEPPGFSFQQKALTGVTYDSTDSPLNPSRGGYASATAAFINAQIVDQNGQNTLGSFVKFDLTGKWFAQFANSWTLATLLRFGGAYHVKLVENAAKRLPLNERYRLGGALGVRGFSTGGISQFNRNRTVKGTPNTDSQVDSAGVLLKFACATSNKQGDCIEYDIEDDGDVMLNGTVELRTPPIFFDPFRLAFFWDFGGISKDLPSLGWHSLRQGVGLGLRFLVSGQLPIRLDIASPIGSRCLDPEVSEEQACSREEPQVQFHAAMLYSF